MSSHDKALTVLLLFILLLLVGCGSTRLNEVEVPETSALRFEVPDTLARVQALDLDTTGVRTQPTQVQTVASPDTANRWPVRGITITPEEITVDTGPQATTYQTPATGETLTITGDSSGTTRGYVSGQQQRRTIPVTLEEDSGPGFWTQLRYSLYAVGGILLVVLLIRLLT